MEKQIGSEKVQKGQDSKVSREFLRKVMKSLGRSVPHELTLNSWELYDFIEKDIQILLKRIARDEGNIRSLMSADEDRRQFTLQAIGDFYEKGNGRRNKGEKKGNQVERENEDKVE